jgi:hypothetical protein
MVGDIFKYSVPTSGYFSEGVSSWSLEAVEFGISVSTSGILEERESTARRTSKFGRVDLSGSFSESESSPLICFGVISSELDSSEKK